MAQLTGTASILVDRSHGGYMVLYGFLSDLVASGWEITDNARDPITADLLLQHDMLIVCNSYTPWSPDELDAVRAYMSAGGGLLVLGDAGWSLGGVNSLAEIFGVRFHPNDMILDHSDNEGFSIWPTIHVLDSHPVTEGIEEFGYYEGLCLEVSSPSRSIARGDGDAFSLFCPSAPTAIAVYEDFGRAVFYGDHTPFFWTSYPDELDSDEIQLLLNIFSWLAAETVVSVDERSWGSVKSMFR